MEQDDYWNVKREKKSRWNVFLLKYQAEIIKECHLLFQQEYPSLHMVYHSISGKVKWKTGTGLAFHKQKEHLCKLILKLQR